MPAYNAIRTTAHSTQLLEGSSHLFYADDLFLVKKCLFSWVGMFFISFALFAFLSPNALINGDAALYEQQIVHFDFSHRTIHLGYYLLGMPFIHLLPLPSDYALNLMNCFFGALSIALIFTIAFTISENLLVAFVASILQLTNHLFFYNAVYAEVYVPQLCFFLLSLQLVLLHKAISGGMVFALAFLITPSSLFGFPCLMIVLRDKKSLFYFSTAAVLVISIALAPHLNDYFFGGRGLLKALQTRMSIHNALLKESNEFFSSFLVYLPLLAAGIIKIVTDKRLHRLGVALIILWLTSFLFGERFGDVPAQLPAYALFSIIGGLGFHCVLRLCRGRSTVITCTAYIFLIFCVSITGLFTFRRIEATNQRLIDYRSTVLAINQGGHPNYLVLGEWTEGILFEHYIFKDSYTGVWINTEWLSGDWGQHIQEESRSKLHDALSAGREVWLLGADLSLFPDLQQEGYVIEPFRNCYRARLKIPQRLHEFSP